MPHRTRGGESEEAKKRATVRWREGPLWHE
jgi:hypothetical protein